MVGGASQIGLTAIYGQGEDGGQLFFSANLGEVDDERPLDYVQLRVRDKSGPLSKRSSDWVVRLLNVHVVSFSPRHAYARDWELTRKFAGGGSLFRLGNYTYIPRPLEARLVPSGVRQEPMGEGAVLVLPNERPDALLPVCRELAGPVAELVGW